MELRIYTEMEVVIWLKEELVGKKVRDISSNINLINSATFLTLILKLVALTGGIPSGFKHNFFNKT